MNIDKVKFHPIRVVSQSYDTNKQDSSVIETLKYLVVIFNSGKSKHPDQFLGKNHFSN